MRPAQESVKSRIRQRLDRQTPPIEKRTRKRARENPTPREPRTAEVIEAERGQAILDREAVMSEGTRAGNRARGRNVAPAPEPEPELPPEVFLPDDPDRPLNPYDLLIGARGENGARVQTGDRDFLYDQLRATGVEAYESPADLMDGARRYFTWMRENPLVDYKVAHSHGIIVPMAIPKMRMMTITSLCLHLMISRATFKALSENPEFEEVIEAIEATIHSQKIEGAGADMLNANIVAREMGLADRTDVTSDGEGIAKIVRRIVDEKPRD